MPSGRWIDLVRPRTFQICWDVACCIFNAAQSLLYPMIVSGTDRKTRRASVVRSPRPSCIAVPWSWHMHSMGFRDCAIGRGASELEYGDLKPNACARLLPKHRLIRARIKCPDFLVMAWRPMSHSIRRANLVVFKGEEISRNIWISFRDLERSNVTIQTRLRILNPHHSGFAVEFVF